MTKLVKGILIAAIAVVVLLGIAIGVVVAVSLYQWKNVVRIGNETATVQNLKTISVVQAQYYTAKANYATFDQLIEEGYLSSKFARDPPVVDGYVFDLKVTPASAGWKSTFTINADPESPGTGTRHFFVDNTSPTIRVNLTRPASADDTPHVK
jgi:hypothetical protein